jgi:hypothetical protein
MIRLERECEDFRDFGIKGCAPLCINRTQNCWSTGTVARKPSHEEIQEIAGRMVNTFKDTIKACTAITFVFGNEFEIMKAAANDALTYTDSSGVEWNVKEGE